MIDGNKCIDGEYDKSPFLYQRIAEGKGNVTNCFIIVLTNMVTCAVTNFTEKNGKSFWCIISSKMDLIC